MSNSSAIQCVSVFNFSHIQKELRLNCIISDQHAALENRDHMRVPLAINAPIIQSETLQIIHTGRARDITKRIQILRVSFALLFKC